MRMGRRYEGRSRAVGLFRCGCIVHGLILPSPHGVPTRERGRSSDRINPTVQRGRCRAAHHLEQSELREEGPRTIASPHFGAFTIADMDGVTADLHASASWGLDD